jgi:hypothetical protein
LQRFSKSLLTAGLTGIAAGLLAAVTIVPASAQTFAAFDYVGPADVTYDNATGNLSGTGIPVTFHFDQTGFGPGLLQPTAGPSPINFTTVNATLSVTGHRTANVTGAPNASQAYVIDNFTITENIAGNPLLLSGSGNPASLNALIGGTTAGLTSSLPPAGSVVQFSSDFVTFPADDAASIAWTFTKPLPTTTMQVAGNGNYILNTGGNPLLNPSGNFTFVPSAAVPEPGVVALFSSLGVCGTVFGLRRLRRRK